MTLYPNPDVISKRLDETTVLVHIPTNRIFELNETGTRVWEMLGQGLDADGIARNLLDDFDVEAAQAVEEVNSLLLRLQSEGLVSA
jgi:Coenzyme PQQ synthesis protein D (PqqD)